MSNVALQILAQGQWKTCRKVFPLFCYRSSYLHSCGDSIWCIAISLQRVLFGYFLSMENDHSCSLRCTNDGICICRVLFSISNKAHATTCCNGIHGACCTERLSRFHQHICVRAYLLCTIISVESTRATACGDQEHVTRRKASNCYPEIHCAPHTDLVQWSSQCCHLFDNELQAVEIF